MGSKEKNAGKLPLDVEELESLVNAETKWAAKVYAAAKYYISLGWPIIPVSYGNKKLPGSIALKRRGMDPMKYRDAATTPEQIKQWFDPTHGAFKGYNLGLACGGPVSVVDLDVKDGKNGIKAYGDNFGFEYGRIPIAETPSGGIHLVFKHQPGLIARSDVLPGVDIRGSTRKNALGSHIVIYPSVVTAQKDGSSVKISYKWKQGGQPTSAPDTLIEHLSNVVHINPNTPATKKGRGNENVTDDDYFPDCTLEDITAALEHIEPTCDYDTWLKIGMSLSSEFPGMDGFEVYLKWSEGGTNFKSEKDCYSKWQSFSDDDQGIRIATLFYMARKGGYRKPGELSPQLVSTLRYTANGALQRSNHNLWCILQSPEFVDEYSGALIHDTFTDVINAGEAIMVNEGYVGISRWISTKFYFERGADVVRQFSQLIAKENETDSLTNYVRGLEWDGKDRLGKLSEELCAANDYQQAIIKRWLIGAVSRAMHPGCTSTHMLILFGEQGLGKSRFFAHLCPNPDWFTDSPVFKFGRETAHRDEEIKLQGKWIIEVPELAGIWKSDFNDLNNFLTLQAPVVRKPYSPDAIPLPRRCVFGGSTNYDSIINDSTGSRRFAFLSLRDRKIDIQWVIDNRDQIWAQAKGWYDNKEQWWFNEKEFKMQTIENRGYQREHPWTDKLLDWSRDKSRFTYDDIFEHCIQKSTAQRTGNDLAIIKGILQLNHYRRRKIKIVDSSTSTNAFINPSTRIDDLFKGKKWEVDSNTDF